MDIWTFCWRWWRVARWMNDVLPLEQEKYTTQDYHQHECMQVWYFMWIFFWGLVDSTHFLPFTFAPHPFRLFVTSATTTKKKTSRSSSQLIHYPCDICYVLGVMKNRYVCIVILRKHIILSISNSSHIYF